MAGVGTWCPGMQEEDRTDWYSGIAVYLQLRDIIAWYSDLQIWHVKRLCGIHIGM